MKIYKIYSEQGEAQKNETRIFETQVEEQNGGKAEYFADETAAVARYETINIKKNAIKHSYVNTVYVYEGKILESAYIDDEEYQKAIADGKTLEDIYDTEFNRSIEKINVSAPYEEI